MQFEKAQRKKAKLRLAITGPAGSGKTWGALEIAKGLGGKIAVIDTERGSASLYSDRADFDTLELNPPYTPERCTEAIRTAEKAGYDIIIFDSSSHEWNGSGGCLEINDALAQSKFKGNTWAAWNETTPRHRSFVDAIIQSPCHFIATMRTKMETAQVEENGRKKVIKLGMKVEQRDGMDYEYTLVFDLEHGSHWATASKDRTNLFPTPHKITTETGKRLLDWSNSGAAVIPPADIHADAIRNATTLDELKAVFGVVNKDKRLSEADKLTLTSLKDARKAALTPAATPTAASQPREPGIDPEDDGAGDPPAGALFGGKEPERVGAMR